MEKPPKNPDKPPDPRHRNPKKCSWCGGTGKVSTMQDGKEVTERCPHCGGTGQAR